MLSPRMKAAMGYLGRSAPFYKWRISFAECPNCGSKRPFLSLDASPFMTRCLGCKANVTNLSLIPVIKAHNERHPIKDAYELSTYGATLSFLQKTYPSVTTSEYIPEYPFGEIVEGVLNEDIQNLTFKDNSFDLLTSNHVFEHVADDIKGFSEAYRVLRPGGAFIFSVPFYQHPTTVQMASVENDQIIHHHPPEYHDSRIAGPKSALTFWHHTIHDICDRVRAGGFKDVELMDVFITDKQVEPSKVVYAVK